MAAGTAVWAEPIKVVFATFTNKCVEPDLESFVETAEEGTEVDA